MDFRQTKPLITLSKRELSIFVGGLTQLHPWNIISTSKVKWNRLSEEHIFRHIFRGVPRSRDGYTWLEEIKSVHQIKWNILIIIVRFCGGGSKIGCDRFRSGLKPTNHFVNLLLHRVVGAFFVSRGTHICQSSYDFVSKTSSLTSPWPSRNGFEARLNLKFTFPQKAIVCVTRYTRGGVLYLRRTLWLKISKLFINFSTYCFSKSF